MRGLSLYVYRRQILTYKDGPRTERVKPIQGNFLKYKKIKHGGGGVASSVFFNNLKLELDQQFERQMDEK